MTGRMQGWRDATLGRLPAIRRKRPGAKATENPAPKRKLPWYYKTAVILGGVLLVVSGTVLGLYYGLGNHYDNLAGHEQILDEDILGDLPENGPWNFLVLGTDSRGNEAGDQADTADANSDTIMLVHIAEGLQKAFIVSIPRDSWVEIPAAGDFGGGMDKINAAFRYGGPALTARTIVNLTGIKLDGAVIVNFNGIREMVDAIGGVHVCPPYRVPLYKPHWKEYPQFTHGWEKGKCYDMSGLEAQAFSRQRHDVPGGDFGRMKSQQLVMRAVAEKATSFGVLTNPVKLDALLSAVARSLTIDESLHLRALAVKLVGIKPGELKFATLPHNGTARIDGQSTVQLNPQKDQELFQAILHDTTDAWLALHPQSEVADYGATD